MHNDSYKKMIGTEKKAKHYFRFGEVNKIVNLYFEIAGNMAEYQGMKEEIWKKIFKVGALHEAGKTISKDFIQKLFRDLSTDLHKEKNPQSTNAPRKKGGQIGNQNARKTGLYSALDSTLEEDRKTELYQNCLSNLQKDYKHLGKYVDLSNMEDLALLKVSQDKVKHHKAHYLKKYRIEALCNPQIIMLATDGKAPAFKESCASILTRYRDVSEEERDMALRQFHIKIENSRVAIEETKETLMDLYSEGMYRKKTGIEIKEFTVRQKNAQMKLEALEKERDQCEISYYAIKYNAEVWDYISQIPDAETKHWGSLLTREIRIQRGIDAKIRLLSQSERQLKALLKALYSFSSEMEKKGEKVLSEEEQKEIYLNIKDFVQFSLPVYGKKTA